MINDVFLLSQTLFKFAVTSSWLNVCHMFTVIHKINQKFLDLIWKYLIYVNLFICLSMSCTRVVSCIREKNTNSNMKSKSCFCVYVFFVVCTYYLNPTTKFSFHFVSFYVGFPCCVENRRCSRMLYMLFR